MKALLLLTLVFTCFIFSTAQTPQWKNFTFDDIISTLADDGNFIWIGTTSGLVKLDKTSRESKLYTKSSMGLSDDAAIYSIIVVNNNFWIGTFGGVAF